MRDKAFFLQIGFNKTATSAFFFLFLKSGYKPVHGNGRYWWRRKHPAVVGRRVPFVIRDNIAAGRPPLETLEEFDAFFDMEESRVNPPIENFRAFDVFAEAYPNAKFLLNTRDVDDWVKSRSRHADGQYLEDAMNHMGLSRQEVIDFWVRDFEDHHRRVKAYFADQPDRLLVFDINQTPIEACVEFAKPDFKLKRKKWKRVRDTDKIANKRGWQSEEV